MPGIMRQLSNFIPDPATGLLPSGLTSVLPNDLRDSINQAFKGSVPLHHVDLSGYGLSTFSEWSQDVERRWVQVCRILRFLQSRVPRFERSHSIRGHPVPLNSVRMRCSPRAHSDSGTEELWPSLSHRYRMGGDRRWRVQASGSFSKGGGQIISEYPPNPHYWPDYHAGGAGFEVEPVIFNADAAIDGATEALVPIYDRPGYVGTNFVPRNPKEVVPPIAELEKEFLTLLYQKVHAISGPIDCAVRVGGTLQAQISSIVSDLALDVGGEVGFAVAIVGTPKLPRAGQWTVVCIDPNTREASPTDARRGVPMVRDGAGPFRFREPSDTRRPNAKTDYALLMSTDTSRVLFQRPFIKPLHRAPGKLQFEVAPLLADPYSLTQSTGLFPRPNFCLKLKKIASFQITADNLWRIDTDRFTFAILGEPLPDFLQGGGWGLNREYDDSGKGPKEGLEYPTQITLAIDSAAPAGFNLAIPPSILKLQLPDPLNEIIHIRNQYQSVAGGRSQLAVPELVFTGALSELTHLLDSLAALVGLPIGFHVSVTAGSGSSPSFVVHMHLLFGIGNGPDGRIECGLGKFSGQFRVDGELEAAVKGLERALLFIEFQGDVQQGIFPPLLYAGGLIRFSVELHDTGAPVIQLTFGVVISIGGDLIPELLAIEGTIKYGYSLIPETLSPGILLGIEARAKLLAGLIGFSFSVEAMARIKRSDNLAFVTVWAQLHIAASVHVAIFFDEDIDFHTQFQQDIPVVAFAVVPGAGLAVVAAEIPL